MCKGRQREDPGVQGMASDLGCLEKEEVAETTLERRVRAKLGGPRMPAEGVETLECLGDSGSEVGDKMKGPCGCVFPFGLQPSAFRKMFLGAQGSMLLVSRPLLVPSEAASLWFILAAP